MQRQRKMSMFAWKDVPGFKNRNLIAERLIEGEFMSKYDLLRNLIYFQRCNVIHAKMSLGPRKLKKSGIRVEGEFMSEYDLLRNWKQRKRFLKHIQQILDGSHCLCKICKDKGKCSCGSLIGKNVIELKKLTELLEVTPEILVDDDEVSEIENQRFFYRNKQKGTLSKWCNERQSKPRKKERCLRQLFDK